MSKEQVLKFNRKNNKEKFKDFYAYSPFVNKLIYESGLCGVTYKSSTDILQEVYCKVWVNIDKYNPEISSIPHYLWKLTCSVIKTNFKEMNFKKRKGQCLTASLSMEVCDGVLLEEQLQDDFERDMMDHAENVSVAKEVISLLTDRESPIIHKRFYENKTMQSIGNELGISKQRVGQILNRIKTRIGKKLSYVFA